MKEINYYFVVEEVIGLVFIDVTYFVVTSQASTKLDIVDFETRVMEKTKVTSWERQLQQVLSGKKLWRTIGPWLLQDEFK